MQRSTRIKQDARTGGFTLIELTIVIFIIGVVSAIAIPQLMPAIVFSRLEGEARHLAAYGRQVLAESTMRRERHVVRFDLDNQEYHVVRWELPELDEDEAAPDELAQFMQLRQASGMGRSQLLEQMSAGRMGMQGAGNDALDYDDELANMQMGDRFAQFARQATLDRAENVEFEGGILDEIGPLFGDEDQFSLDDSMEPVEVVVQQPTLGMTRLRDEIQLAQIVVDGMVFSEGLVEVEVGALGFMEKSAFYFQDDGQNYYTVIWDPVLSTTRFYDGWRDIE